MVFSPWALAGWPTWSVWTLNVAGYILWLLLAVKAVTRRLAGYRPLRWNEARSPWPGRALAMLSALVVGWSLVSALNARAVVDVENLRSVERTDFVGWLPHSFHAPATWFHFWTALGLAGMFWGARDWLSLIPRRERARSHSRPGSEHPAQRVGEILERRGPHFVPRRLRHLLWVASVNGALLALVGMISVWDQPTHVLWMAEHPTRQSGFFGPFWYRNNAAQYFNLLWPVVLGFWHTRYLRAVDSGRPGRQLTNSADLLLLPCLLLMLAAPLMSLSRGGSLIALTLLAACLGVLLAGTARRGWRFAAPLILAPLGMGLGLWLVWEPLAGRFLREFRVFTTGVAALEQFTLRCTFETPPAWGTVANVAGLSEDSRIFGGDQHVLTLRVVSSNQVSVRLSGATREQYVEWRGAHAGLAHPGRFVELVLVQSNAVSRVYVNGAEVPLRRRSGRDEFTWPERFATRYLWVARGDGNPIIRKQLRSVTLLGYALSGEEVMRLYLEGGGRAVQTGWLIGDAWEDLEPKPLLSVRPNQASPGAWVASGFGGRTSFYQDTREMLGRYPALWGAGPGSFPVLYQLYLGDPHATDAWYVHNDHLELRFTHGWLGMILVYLLLVAAVAPVFGRAGLPLPWYLGICALLALAGSLVHAAFDFVFQTHAVLFLAVLLCAVLSVSGLRRSPA